MQQNLKLKPYYYSTYEEECEVNLSSRNKVILQGSDQIVSVSIEFDYLVHAKLGLAGSWHETIMVNSNPETVSTDMILR